MQTEAISKEILVAAADHIEANGWQQFSYGRLGGPCCLLGAIAAGARVVSRQKALGFDLVWTSHAVDLFRGRTGILKAGAWNDELGRTKEEVVAKLREAAA